MHSGSPAVVDWIALNLLPGVGPVALRAALERYGDPRTIAYRLPPKAFLELPGVGQSVLPELTQARQGLINRAEKEWRRCEKNGIRVVVDSDPAFPAAFECLKDAPILLYQKGELPHAIVRVAVVGSRNATLYGKRIATGMAGELAVRGVEVVSGGARGIDTCAHRGALEAEGRTVAVVGSGLLCPYPAENARLFERIAERGAVVSEFPLGFPPARENFPRRNRLISALSAAVVVVEAAERSGALITASIALDLGREVLAVPGPVTSARSEGCNRLIQQGAKLVQNTGDILDELSPMYRPALPFEGPAELGPELDGLSQDERFVLGILDDVEPVHLDDLVEKSPFGIARLQTALFGLQLRGAVEQTPGRYYVSRPWKEP
jgi:DNA processing protein